MIARKFYPENRIGEPLAEEKKFQVDKDGKIVTETHRTIVRDDKGVRTGEKVEKIEHSKWGKTFTTENRKTDAEGQTTGGTKWVVTKRPGKKDVVKKFEWKEGDWVEQAEPEGGWQPGEVPGEPVKIEMVEMELKGGKQNRPAPPSLGDDVP